MYDIVYIGHRRAEETDRTARHSEMSNTSKGWRDSGKGGVIRLQKLAPLGGSRTTVGTSWKELES